MASWSWKDVKRGQAEASIEVRFRLRGDHAKQMTAMAEVADLPPSELARSLVIDVLDDDRAAHGETQ